MNASVNRRRPLAHLQVLDLADQKASYCSLILASLGARVIKIEKPGGDSSREIGPFFKKANSLENSLFFWFNNTDKFGITLNLDMRRGRSIFRKLVVVSDVVVESFRPGYLKKIRLDYSRLSKLNPRVILASVTGFGQTGPHRLFESCDIVTSAVSGQMSLCGVPGENPLKLFGEQTGYMASLFAATGILLALEQRNKDKKGQHIDISMQEAAIGALENTLVRYFREKTVMQRSGPYHWSNTSGIFPCKDGNIFLTFDREWDTLVDWLTAENMHEDLRASSWLNEGYRRQHSVHINEVITKWTKTHTVNELFQTAQLMRFPWAPVQNIPKLFSNRQLVSRKFFKRVDHHNLNRAFFYPSVPINLPSMPQKFPKRAPLVGEHNFQIYHKILHISKKKLALLEDMNII